MSALAAGAPARAAAPLHRSAARSGLARARPLSAPCRFVGGGSGSGGSNRRGGGVSPAPQHPPTITTLDEALARLAEARLAASEAVERLARMANDPDEAVAELVSKLSGVTVGGEACRAAAARRQRQRSRSRSGRRSSISSSTLWAAPPIVVMVDAIEKQRLRRQQRQQEQQSK
jgi:hypothetical protein